MNNHRIPMHAPIDCGATGIAFMDQVFACHHQIPQQELREKKQVDGIDRRPIECGDITHIAQVGMKVHNHEEQLPMFVTKLGHYRIVMGIPWLQWYDIAVHFASNTVTLGLQYCTTHHYNAHVLVQAVTEDPPESVCHEKNVFEL